MHGRRRDQQAVRRIVRATVHTTEEATVARRVAGEGRLLLLLAARIGEHRVESPAPSDEADAGERAGGGE